MGKRTTGADQRGASQDSATRRTCCSNTRALLSGGTFTSSSTRSTLSPSTPRVRRALAPTDVSNSTHRSRPPNLLHLHSLPRPSLRSSPHCPALRHVERLWLKRIPTRRRSHPAQSAPVWRTLRNRRDLNEDRFSRRTLFPPSFDPVLTPRTGRPLVRPPHLPRAPLLPRPQPLPPRRSLHLHYDLASLSRHSLPSSQRRTFYRD